MIYITGDTHGNFRDIKHFCVDNKTTKDDVLIILGDSGINYFEDYRDVQLKTFLSKLPITFFMVRGNHEQRPSNIDTYEIKFFKDGGVYYEEEYPNLLFAIDGQIFNFNKNKTLIIGGAYSVDKFYRLERGSKWFRDEQLSIEEKQNIIRTCNDINWNVDCVLTHTCPDKYIPVEMFLSCIDSSKVDYNMEKWLDGIEDKLTYKKWYCGHYHTDKEIDKLEILYKHIKEFSV